MGKRIYCGNLSFRATEDDVRELFSQYGEVTDVHLVIDRETGRSRGFAFVEFAAGESCKLALASREQTIKGKQVRTSHTFLSISV